MSCRMQTQDTVGKLPCKHYIKSDIKGHAGFCKLPTRFICEEALKVLNPPMSMSAMKSFLQCPYKYYLHYIRGISKKNTKLPSPLKVGSIWDTFMEMQAGGDTPTFAEMVEKYHPTELEIAKIRGLVKAFKSLNIKICKGETQKQLIIPTSAVNNVNGFMDICYPDGFAEVKLSGRPDFYLEPENISLQLGTYFLSDNKLEYCDMLITKYPQLRLGKNENYDNYENRVYGTIIGSPSEYFLGFKRDTRTYGRRFFRSEFNLDNIRNSFNQTFRLVRFCQKNGEWLANKLSCHVPAPCEYLDHCRTKCFSEILYQQTDVNEAKGGMR